MFKGLFQLSTRPVIPGDVRKRWEVSSDIPLVDLFVQLPVGDVWEDASLIQCLRYVLRSKLLKVPEEYNQVFPQLFGFCLP